MSGEKKPPVIFLVYANDRVDPEQHLRSLSTEVKLIREALRSAEQAKLCEVHIEPNATPNELFSVFQNSRYRDRIAIFHYAGHANDYELLLESASGAHEAVFAKGLAAFLGEQLALNLVFLNGCSTEQQAEGLLAAKCSAVIATSEAIDDSVAMDFAHRFYTGVGGGKSAHTAFNEAVAATKATKGKDGKHRTLYWGGTEPPSDRWPWERYPRDDAAGVWGWSLPQLAGDPLFGLPVPPPRDLPLKPYLGLHWYTEQHAELFFGRAREIRALYDLLLAEDGDPIVLVYGTTGVGKSSLLNAGLKPRLDAKAIVVSKRRGSDLGLTQALTSALDAAPDEPVETVWLRREDEDAKPLIIILDQAESAFSPDNPNCNEELEAFGAALRTVFLGDDSRPRGRLVLSFRKERLAEVEDWLKAAKLEDLYTTFFLQPVGRDAVVEVIEGPTRHRRLRNKYRLTVQKGVSQAIPARLVSDEKSPVAPTLQLLLTKMWEKAKSRSGKSPTFDAALFTEVTKGEELVLDDFLGKQLDELRAGNAEVVDSGFALDLLMFHTTDTSVAAQRTREDLNRRYVHRRDILNSLIAQCKDLYLLADPAGEEQGTLMDTRLTHDTIAPLIRRRFQQSDCSGQRATRILELRVVDWTNGRQGTMLDEAALRVVESGATGMRAWTEDEERLVEASRKEHNRRRVRRRIFTGLGVFSVVIIAITAVIATWQWRQSVSNEIVALAKSSEHQFASNSLLLGALIDALNAGLRLKSLKLMEPEEGVRRQAITALFHAVHGVREINRLEEHESDVHSVSFSPNGKLIATASKDDTVKIWSAEGKYITTLKGRHSDEVYSVSFSPDSKTLATASFDKTIKLWRSDGSYIKDLGEHKDHVFSIKFSPDGKLIATASKDDTVKLWSAGGEYLTTLNDHGDDVHSVSFSTDGRMLASASYDNYVHLYSLEYGSVFKTKKKASLLHSGRVYSVDFNPVRQEVATAGKDGKVSLWSLAGSLLHEFTAHHTNILKVVFSPDGQMIATASWDTTAKLWTRDGHELQTFSGHQSGVVSVDFSPDGQLLATGSQDATAKLWNLKKLQHRILNHGRDVKSVAFSPDGELIATASWERLDPSKNSAVKLWSVHGGRQVRPLPGHEEGVRRVSFHPKGEMLATVGNEGLLRLWNRDAELLMDPLSGHNKTNIEGVTFSPDGETIATAGLDKQAILWAKNGGQLEIKQKIPHDQPVWDVAFSPNAGERIAIATASQDGTVKLWSHDAKKPLDTLQVSKHGGKVFSVAFSPDGQLIAAGGADRTAIIWNLNSKSTKTLRGHQGSVSSVSFSPDGQLIATGSDDRTVRLWNSEGELLQTLRGHNNMVKSVNFSPNGRFLATGSSDGTAILWDRDLALASLDTLLSTGCEWIQAYLEHNTNVSEANRTLCRGIGRSH